MAKCFVVLGHPRSGTSLVSGIMHAMGVRMANKTREGKWNWPLPNQWNPTGFYQDLDFWKLLYRVHRKPLTTTEQERLRSLIADREAPGEVWGVKNPNTAFVFDTFAECLGGQLSVVRTHRETGRSIQSWKSYCEADHDIPLIRHTIDKLNLFDVPFIDVAFDELIDNSEATIRRIAEFCGTNVTQEALNLPNPEFRRF